VRWHSISLLLSFIYRMGILNDQSSNQNYFLSLIYFPGCWCFKEDLEMCKHNNDKFQVSLFKPFNMLFRFYLSFSHCTAYSYEYFQVFRQIRASLLCWAFSSCPIEYVKKYKIYGIKIHTTKVWCNLFLSCVTNKLLRYNRTMANLRLVDLSRNNRYYF
jgi:hypothetical protein